MMDNRTYSERALTLLRIGRDAVENALYGAIKPYIAKPEVKPFPFILGNQYFTQGGELVRFVSVSNEGTTYETMADEAGIHRYTKRDFGRVTGTNHDYSDPRNVPPLYAAPPNPACKKDDEQSADAECIEQIKAERDALAKEMLTPQVYSRLVEWLQDPEPKNAVTAFTAGIERQIAYALEMSVLPVIKSLRVQLANAESGQKEFKTKLNGDMLDKLEQVARASAQDGLLSAQDKNYTPNDDDAKFLAEAYPSVVLELVRLLRVSDRVILTSQFL